MVGGGNTVIALDERGCLTAWGDAEMGTNRLALSDEEFQDGPPWSMLLGLRGVIDVALGAVYVLAAKLDGTVWQTGGRHADSTPETRPHQVKGLESIVAVGSGWLTKYALRTDGTVWAWGDAQRNQIGDGAMYVPGPSMSGLVTSRDVPTRAHLPGRATALASANWSAYALLEDGTVCAWGNNEHGELGNGQRYDVSRLGWNPGTQVPKPARVHGLTNIVAIAAGGSTAYAVQEDGTLWGWGEINLGQLAANTSTEPQSLPVRIEGIPPIRSVSTSGDSTFAIAESGAVWAWGLNREGQLGDGSQVDRNTPVQVPKLQGATSITCVGKATFALLPTTNLV
jgi:alpha-tubulin suppressor-like RCC1 family protein